VGAARENVPGGKRGSGKWVWRLPETASLAGGVQGGHTADPGRLERPQGENAAEYRVSTPVLQDTHPNGETGPSADYEHLEGDKRRTRPLTENEILHALNRRGSPAFEQAELYRGGRLAKEEAVEAVARTILKDNGSDDADWRASAPAVEAVLAHPLDCFCEQCW
jgi:hypothetical protein